MSDHRAKRHAQDNELDDWIKIVNRLPFVSAVKRDITGLRRLLYDRRAPRIAAIGHARSGRTSLANALLTAVAFGEDGAAPAPESGRWVRIDADGRRLDWLELTLGDDPHSVSEEAWRSFEEERPDLLLGVLEVGAPDGAATALCDALGRLRRQLSEEHGHDAPILVVLGKVDALPPQDASPPYPSEKMTAIDLALQGLRKELADLALPAETFVAVAATPDDEGGPSARWNVDRVGEEILERLPEAAQMEAVRAFEVGREPRRRVARALVNSCSALAITVGLAPIPFADAFLLLPLQGAMVTGIAYLSGRPWDRRAATEWLASMGIAGGAGIGLRWGAQQLVKLVPGAGSLVGAGVAGAGTLAIGRSAIAYFIDGPGGSGRRLELRADNTSDGGRRELPP